MPTVLSQRPATEPSNPEANDNSLLEPSQPSIQPEKIALLLPSGCSPSTDLSETMRSLMTKEAQLRIAQAYDALSYIKKIRRILVGISAFKHQHISGTGGRANTRVRSLYEKFQGRIRLAALRYRTAYAALLILDKDGSWTSQLRVLDDADIRGPSQDPDDGESEGKREHSWIWLVGTNTDLQSSEADSETLETMRVEWGKTWARAQRWSEEVKLLQEEMRRVLEYLRWKATWWESKAKVRKDVDLAVGNGLLAYSGKQAMIYNRLAQRFAKQWSFTLQGQGIRASWQQQFDKLPRLVSLWEVERIEKELDLDQENEGLDEESEEENEEELDENGSDVEMQDDTA